jgi:hypothetical protein
MVVDPSVSIVFTHSKGELRIEGKNDRWCRVTLSSAGGEIPLGAERLSYLIDHLSSFLQHPKATLSWILSLSERHASLYGSLDASGSIEILVQDANALTIGAISLSESEAATWSATLAQASMQRK